MSTENVREYDFDIVREPWNKYELSDGTTLKTRIILQKVVRRQQGERTGYGTMTQNLQIVFAPRERKGTPSNQTYSQQELQTSVEQEVRYTTTAEEWNEYAVDDGSRIRFHMTVTRISRTSKFDSNGDPIYLVDSSIIGDISPPRV